MIAATSQRCRKLCWVQLRALSDCIDAVGEALGRGGGGGGKKQRSGWNHVCMLSCCAIRARPQATIAALRTELAATSEKVTVLEEQLTSSQSSTVREMLGRCCWL